MEKKKKEIITKSNQMVEARYYLTAWEQKILVMMISKVKKEHTEQIASWLEFDTSVFMEKTDIAKNDYQKIKSVCKGLAGKYFEIEEHDQWKLITLVAGVDIKKKDGKIRFLLTEDMLKHIHGLKGKFTKFEISFLFQLKSAFSIRIYELLKQYEKIGYREFLVDDLKKILGIENAHSYDNFSNFRVRILLTAINEINSKTDIKVSFTTTKKGRKVHKIRFQISHNKRQKIIQEELFKQERKRGIVELSDVAVIEKREEQLRKDSEEKQKIHVHWFNGRIEREQEQIKERFWSDLLDTNKILYDLIKKHGSSDLGKTMKDSAWVDYLGKLKEEWGED